MKKSAIKGGRLLVKESDELDPDKDGYMKANEGEGDDEDPKKVDEDDDMDDADKKKVDEDDDLDPEDKKDEDWEPNLNAAAVNKKFKLLPEDDEPDVDGIMKKLGEADGDDSDKKDDKKDDVAESLTKIFEGSDFTPEFKEKVGAIFEASVNAKAKLKAESLKKKCLEVVKEERIKIREQVTNSVERLMNHFAKGWFKENRVAVVDSVAIELAEGSIKATKDFLSKFNVRVPRSRENLVEKLSLRNSQLQQKLDESLNAQVKLQEGLEKIQKETSIRAIAEGLSDTDKEKFVTLAEEVSFADDKSYRTKLKAIKEGLFDTGAKKNGSEDFAQKMLLEKADPAAEKAKQESSNGSSQRYLSY